jgi:hypothetical protein
VIDSAQTKVPKEGLRERPGITFVVCGITPWFLDFSIPQISPSQPRQTNMRLRCTTATCSGVDRSKLVVGSLIQGSAQTETAKSFEERSA